MIFCTSSMSTTMTTLLSRPLNEWIVENLMLPSGASSSREQSASGIPLRRSTEARAEFSRRLGRKDDHLVRAHSAPRQAVEGLPKGLFQPGPCPPVAALHRHPRLPAQPERWPAEPAKGSRLLRDGPGVAAVERQFRPDEVLAVV